MRFYSILIVFLFTYLSFSAQVDSLKVVPNDSFLTNSTKRFKYKKHSPKVAALLSAVAPGAGQIYNRRYWKLPIVWGGLAGFGYLWINENNRYQDAKTSFLSLIDTDVSNDIPLNGTTNLTVVQNTKNVYRNQRDMYLLFGILFYGLNIIDATVDAHFMNFDVSDDLSMRFNLDMKNYASAPQGVPSLTCTLNFKR
ncbi:MAG: hypothetical protein JNL75_08910 [Chitinophagales bacterium]|nr:hypothetical protein [Chitinophagales bacterium]